MQGEAIELKKASLVDIPGEENLVGKSDDQQTSNKYLTKHPNKDPTSQRANDR